MGDAALGVAVLAPEQESPEWRRKIRLRRAADWLFYIGIVLATGALITQVWAIVTEIPR